LDEKEYITKLLFVKATREQAEQLAAEVVAERTRWNTEHQDLLKAAAEASEVQTRAEAQLRSIVLEEHKVGGQKKFLHGVEVKVHETVQYDEARALRWCQGNFFAAVKQTLDKRAFEAYAKAQLIPGLTEIVKVPKVLLPTKIDIPNEGGA
jgi:hypothetical protein